MRLALSERAVYRELLDYCWVEGSLPIEEHLLASIVACDLREFRKAWNVVKHLFIEQDGRLTHHRVNAGRPKLQSWQESRRTAGKKGGLGRAIAQAKVQGIAKLTPKPSTSTSTSTSTSVENPQTPVPISPTEAEPAYWVERFVEIHPSPCDPRYPWVFCEDNLHRLGDNPVAFAALMRQVYLGLVSWADHWAIDGNRYAKPLEKWLDAGGWKKSPPSAIQAANRTGRFELLEDDDAAK